jgi:hypothetical protein
MPAPDVEKERARQLLAGVERLARVIHGGLVALVHAGPVDVGHDAST